MKGENQMEVINLKKKSVVEIEINGQEFVVALDHHAINHFQKTNKKGLLSIYSSMEDAKKTGNLDLETIIELLGSMIRYKSNGKIVGTKWLEQFDSFAILEHLTPVLMKVLGANLPPAKDESEKK